MGIKTDIRSNHIGESSKYQTNTPNVFAARDMHIGQSLIVWTISEGREVARQVDIYLMGKSELVTKNEDADLVGL